MVTDVSDPCFSGDPDELLSMANSGGSRLMPVLEDGLSSGHVSENDDDEDTGTTVGLIHGDRKMRGTRNRAVRTSALCRVQKSSKGNNRSQRRNKTHSGMGGFSREKSKQSAAPTATYAASWVGRQAPKCSVSPR